MATWKQQTHLEAPVEEVWALLENPNRFEEWAQDVEVTGAPTKIEKGSTFTVKAPGPLGIRGTTTFKVEQLEDLHEIKVRCQTSGFYSRWILTDAQGGTFADVEYGVERVPGIEGRVTGAMHTKGYLRRSLERTIDGIRGALRRK